MAIQLTERASQELLDLMNSEGRSSAKLRLWVQPGGCSGMSYGMALDDNDLDAGDQTFESGGVAVVVDAFSLQYVDGSTVDFVEDMVGGGFKIDNPNALRGCGCGSSFQTDEENAGDCGSCGCRS